MTEQTKPEMAGLTTEEARDWIREWSNTSDNQAVLLAGAWGTGKTHFIKQWQKEESAQTGVNKSIIHLSLYGQTGVEQLERKLFYFLHNKGVQVAGNILSIALESIEIKTPIKIKIGNIRENIPKKLFGRMEKRIKETIFFLDDLDRCTEI